MSSVSNRTATRPRVLRDNDHRLTWGDRERAQSVRMALEKQGWQFALSGRPGRVLLCKPDGATWHLAGNDDCDCIAHGYGNLCSHLQAMLEIGTVEALIEALKYYDADNQPTLTHNMPERAKGHEPQ